MERKYNRRKRNHDYYSPFIYHIIIKKLKGAPDFGRIVGNPEINPGEPGCARTDFSKMGYAIFYGLKEFERRYPEIEKLQYSIMPDHIHLILYKKVKTEFHLETYINWLKDIIACRYEKETKKTFKADNLFEDRFTDKLLYDRINLKQWINYVKCNPQRRAIILQRPGFFEHRRQFEINGTYHEIYGNIFLLYNPDKHPVHVRRYFSKEEIQDYEALICELGREQTILVSPFISRAEKSIRNKSMTLGAKFIMIKHEEFGEKYKPSGFEYELCARGRLLLVSMGMTKGTPTSYAINSSMNRLAELICQG